MKHNSWKVCTYIYDIFEVVIKHASPLVTKSWKIAQRCSHCLFFHLPLKYKGDKTVVNILNDEAGREIRLIDID